MSELNFSSRLNGYDPKAPELLNLADAVNTAADRADGVLNALFWAHQTNGNTPSEKQVCGALESVIMEVQEIRALVNHYQKSMHKAPDKNTQAKTGQ